MEATVLLCDFAEATNGKLYVMGGGWNVLRAPDTPVNVALAVVVAVPWDQTNTTHQIRVELLTADGDVVDQQGRPVDLRSEFEVGRPAGVKPGTSLNAPFSFAFNGLTLEVGSYEFKVGIDGEPVASRPFTVSGQSPSGAGQAG